MNLKDRIRTLRKELGLNQTDFANKLGMTLRGIQKWEAGKGDIKESSLLLLEFTFNVNPAWLRQGEGNIFLTDSDDQKRDGLTDSIMYYIGQLSEEDREKAFKYIQDLQRQSSEKQTLEDKSKNEKAG